MYIPSMRDAKSFEIKFDNSSPLKDMSFTIEGLSHAIKHSERMCMSCTISMNLKYKKQTIYKVCQYKTHCLG